MKQAYEKTVLCFNFDDKTWCWLDDFGELHKYVSKQKAREARIRYLKKRVWELMKQRPKKLEAVK